MNTLPSNISYRPERKDGNYYRVRFMRDGKRRTIGYYATEQEAIEERNAFLREETAKRYQNAAADVKRERLGAEALSELRDQYTMAMGIQEMLKSEHESPSPIIVGATLDARTTDVEALWEQAIKAQRDTERLQELKASNQITLPHEPVAIAFLSDQHIGSAGSDYASMRRDAETIRDTPGMYAIMHGDLGDNWIIGKLTALQAGQALNGDGEIALFRDYINMLRAKLLVVVPGNHDLWTKKIARIEPMADLLAGLKILYDKFQVDFRLIHGAKERVVSVRHKWRFNSVFNPTHGLEVGWERGATDYDWAVGGHTHIGTYFRDFHRHGKRRTAILTGAYKRVDAFADEIGFAPCADNGCGAIVLDTDGGQAHFNDLQTAAKYLAFLKSK